MILIVGCSYPGVERILQEAGAIDSHVHILFGGLHQIQKPDPEIERIATVLHDQYKLETSFLPDPARASRSCCH